MPVTISDQLEQDHAFALTFYITSTKERGDIRALVEAYISEACSKLEAEGLELTYRLGE